MPKKPEKEVEMPFPSTQFSEIWAEYLKHRREKGASSYTPTGLKRIFKGLIRDSQNDETTAIKIIEQSLEKNWTGLFPLKNNQSNDTRNQTYWQRIGLNGVENSKVEQPL